MKLLQLIEDQLVTERYLGMTTVDREDIGTFVRKRLSTALKTSLDSGVDAEHLISITPQKLAKHAYENTKAKKSFIYVVHGYVKEVSDEDIDSGKAKRVEKTFLITNMFKVAKKIDMELSNGGHGFIYIIDDLDKDAATVKREVATVSAIVGLIKTEVKYAMNVYNLVLKDSSSIDDEDDEDDDNKDDSTEVKKK